MKSSCDASLINGGIKTMIRTLGNKTVSSSSECRTMNGAAALYYNSPALDDGDDDDGSSGSKQQAAGSKQRQQQRRQAQVGVVGGNCWSTRRVFGELTKQAQAIERRHTLTHTHTLAQ